MVSDRDVIDTTGSLDREVDDRAFSGAQVKAGLQRLVAAGTLSDQQAEAVLRELGSVGDGAPGPAVAPHALGRLLGEVGGYLGAAFVIAGIVVFTGAQWDTLAVRLKVGVSAVPALGLAVAGLLIGRPAGPGPRQRLACALLVLTGASAAAATWALVEGSDNWVWPAAWITAAVVWTGAYVLLRGGVLQVAALFGLSWAVGLTVDQAVGRPWNDDLPPTFWSTHAAAGAVVLLGGLWLALALAGVLREQGVGIASAAVVIFVAAEIWVEPGPARWVGFLLMALVAVLGLLGYVLTRTLGVLAVGVVALAVVVPQAVLDLTDGALGSAGALLVVGLSIVAASVLGFRVRQEVTERARTETATEFEADLD